MQAQEPLPQAEERVPEDVRRLVTELVFELAPASGADHDTNARLVEDLGYHSLALLELAFTIEDEFDLEPIDEATAQEIRTVTDIVGYVLTQLGHAPSGAAG